MNRHERKPAIFSQGVKKPAIFANMDEKDLPYVRHAFNSYLAGKIDDHDTADRVVRSIWKRLEKTYRLRRVK